MEETFEDFKRRLIEHKVTNTELKKWYFEKTKECSALKEQLELSERHNLKKVERINDFIEKVSILKDELKKLKET